MAIKSPKKPGAYKSTAEVGFDPDKEQYKRGNEPMLGSPTSASAFVDETGDGIEIRGCKNTTRGKRARGPMA